MRKKVIISNFVFLNQKYKITDNHYYRMTDNRRSRNWMGVMYNYDDPSKHHNFGGTGLDVDEFLRQKLNTNGCIGGVVKYVLYGKEVCPTTGTKHLQMFFCFKNEKSLKSVVEYMSQTLMQANTISFKRADNNVEECVKYCCKDNNDVIEYGERPSGKGARNDLKVVIEKIKSGADLKTIAFDCPEQFIHYSGGIQKLMVFLKPPRNFLTHVYWIYGPTGTGKSRWVHQQVDVNMCYFKNGNTKWWDGYAGQSDVIIDDFRPSKELPFEYMLRLLDRYPLQVETKGGVVQFTSRRIFITCPHTPEDTWRRCEWLTEENIAQFIRRLKTVLFFPSLNCLASLSVAPVWQAEVATVIEEVATVNEDLVN